MKNRSTNGARLAYAGLLLALLQAAAGSAAARDYALSESSQAPLRLAQNKPTDANFDVERLFASTCGWCHSNGGREAGKGPQLMASTLTDGEMVYRIKNGKPGFMPAFRNQFNESQINAIVGYIRALKPN
jgi:mono/diheme cytochrome c family protein